MFDFNETLEQARQRNIQDALMGGDGHLRLDREISSQ